MLLLANFVPQAKSNPMRYSEKFWDRSARSYDKEEMKDAELRSVILARTRKHLSATDHVLDFGCATGLLSNAIAADVQSIVGIDFSSRMIEIARSKAADQNIPNAAYAHTVIFDASFSTAGYDVILAVYLLHLLNDLPAYLKRIHALLKPGGRFISVTPCLSKKSFTGNALQLAAKAGLIPQQTLFSMPELQSIIKNEDFSIIETECLTNRGQQYFILATRN